VRFLSLIGVLILTTASPAQIVSVYGTYSAMHLSSVETGTVTANGGSQILYTSPWVSGVGGGVTLNFLPLGPIKIGFDLRGSTRKGTTGADTAMVGFRLGFKPPLLPIKPYVQVSGGYIATRTPNTSIYVGTPTGGTYNNQYLGYEVLGGIDYRLLHFVDLRLVEVGGGNGYSVGQIYNAGNQSTQSQQIPIFTINTGVVVHF
jgi:hypothetical protein